jgi:hypothetical protein
VPLQVHLESIERQTGRRPPELDGPQCPPMLWPLWSDFLKIAASERRANLAGVEPLHAADIESWLRLSRRALSAFEFECLQAIDAKYCQINRPEKTGTRD